MNQLLIVTSIYKIYKEISDHEIPNMFKIKI